MGSLWSGCIDGVEALQPDNTLLDGDRGVPRGSDVRPIAVHQVAIWLVRRSTADSGAASSVARPWRAASQAASR
jgi:hypothetical protein